METKKMEIVDLVLQGAFYIRPFEQHDERGAFYKLFTQEALAEKGAAATFSEEFFSISNKGVIRGLHYQAEPFSQAKLINCVRGEVFDVIVDMRKSSKTFGKWASIKLSEKNNITLYVPRGFAHGFAALSDSAYLDYRVDNKYSAAHERGIIYNDPVLDISWPAAEKVIVSEKDGGWPAFRDAYYFD